MGAGPINLAWHVYFQHYKDARELSFALAPIFNAEMKELVAAGAKYIQIEDLGAWLPFFTKNKDDYKWIADVIAKMRRRRRRQNRLALLLRQRLGQCAGLAHHREGYRTVLPHFYHLPIDQFVLDFANREMADIDCLKSLPKDKEVQVGVLDIRTSMIETPEQVAERIRKVLKVVPAGARVSEHGLRHEAAAAHGCQDEAEGAGRRRENRPQRNTAS